MGEVRDAAAPDSHSGGRDDPNHRRRGGGALLLDGEVDVLARVVAAEGTRTTGRGGSGDELHAVAVAWGGGGRAGVHLERQEVQSEREDGRKRETCGLGTLY